jgi:hypothetical protein
MTAFLRRQVRTISKAWQARAWWMPYAQLVALEIVPQASALTQNYIEELV